MCGLRAYTLAPSNALPSRSASLADYHRPLFLMNGAVLVASPFIFLKQPLAAMAAAVTPPSCATSSTSFPSCAPASAS